MLHLFVLKRTRTKPEKMSYNNQQLQMRSEMYTYTIMNNINENSTLKNITKPSRLA